MLFRSRVFLAARNTLPKTVGKEAVVQKNTKFHFPTARVFRGKLLVFHGVCVPKKTGSDKNPTFLGFLFRNLRVASDQRRVKHLFCFAPSPSDPDVSGAINGS